MTRSFYITDLAEVRLSEEEAKFLKRGEVIAQHFGHLANQHPWLARRLEAHRAKMADIEKVALWKFGNGHV